MSDDDIGNDEAMRSVQHLFWLEKLVDVLLDSDDVAALINIDDAAIYFDNLDDKTKLDLFVYTLGCLVRVRRSEESD